MKNIYGFEHQKAYKLGNGKPVIRIKNVAGIKNRYIHIKGNLNPIICSESICLNGYLLSLSIGLEIFQPYAR